MLGLLAKTDPKSTGTRGGADGSDAPEARVRGGMGPIGDRTPWVALLGAIFINDAV